tara:strand:+ start:10197 stop:10766 length:570 start_codon:yes stop_codon:yes gene_type:complete
MKRIVIFASGSGSNAEQIINHFKNSELVSVTKVFTNNKNAGVIDRCKRLNIPFAIFNKSDFSTSDIVLNDVKINADYVILAGFLWRIPQAFVEYFSKKIINIHPALLPKYGGKGMYGMNVHNAVKENKETETGITIHFVNENYDEGAIIFQAKTQLETSDTPEDIANKIHLLEYEYFPKVIEETILKHG